MPVIRVQDLIDLKASSVKIPNDENFPILRNLKIEFRNNYCSVTKNGLSSFMKKNIPAECTPEDGLYLINEESLYNIAENTTTDSISITRDGSNILLKSGKKKAILATEDARLWPKNDTLPEADQWRKLYFEAISNIEIASQIIEPDVENKVVNQNAKYVFCEGKTIFACDGYVTFFKELFDPCPKMILRKEVVSAISKFPGADYASNSSYDFFKTGSLLYGFSKPEANFLNVDPPFRNLPREIASFKIMKEDIIKFNNVCIRSGKTIPVRATFNCPTSKELQLNFRDPDSSVQEYTDIIEVENASGEFKYDPHVMNGLLKTLPASLIHFYQAQNRFYLTDDNKSFISIIMGTI